MFELNKETKSHTVLKMACLSMEEALSAWNRQRYLTVSILDWKMFVKDILAQVEHPELLPSPEIA